VISVLVAALAIGVDEKRLLNFIARSARQAIPLGRPGRSSELSHDALELLALAFVIQRDLGTTAVGAVELANRLRASQIPEIPLGTLGILKYDLSRFREVLRVAVADALAGAPMRRRGRRPRTKEKRGTSL
jgi:hypothetical protein